MIDDLQQAAHDTVHQYRDHDRRGAIALAPKLGMNPTTLSNKVNPSQDTHHLSLLESITLQLITGDFRVLHQYAQQLDHVVIRLADYSKISDVELLTAYANFHAEIGETAEVIRSMFADGRVTRREVQEVRREGLEDITAFFELLSRLEALVDD